MRSICKKGSATLVAVLALCALTAASASAAQWYTGAKALTGTEKLAETVKVEEPITLTIEIAQPKPKYNATITCTGLKAQKSEIAATATIKLEHMILEGCKLNVPWETSRCTLTNPTLETSSLEAKMSLGKLPEDSAEFGASKKQWLNFAATESCEAITGTWTIQGTTTLKAPKGQTETLEQEFVGEGEASKGLKAFEDSVYLTGKVKLKLASGKAWSFH